MRKDLLRNRLVNKALLSRSQRKPSNGDLRPILKSKQRQRTSYLTNSTCRSDSKISYLPSLIMNFQSLRIRSLRPLLMCFSKFRIIFCRHMRSRYLNKFMLNFKFLTSKACKNYSMPSEWKCLSPKRIGRGSRTSLESKSRARCRLIENSA